MVRRRTGEQNRILICFYLRAFRYTRKGYAVSVRQQSCQRLRSCYALPRRLMQTFPLVCRGGFNIRPWHSPPVGL